MEAERWPYPYGSDLHLLWGWGHRIDGLLYDDGPREGRPFSPSPSTSMIIRPDVGADDAMLRFCTKYPDLMAAVRQSQQLVEQRFAKCLRMRPPEGCPECGETRNVSVQGPWRSCYACGEKSYVEPLAPGELESATESLVDALDHLKRRIFTAAEFISKDSAPPAVTTSDDAPNLNGAESSIVQALREKGATSANKGIVGEQLAPLAGYSFNSNFRSTLSGLTKRGVIRNDRNRGYFLP